MPPNISANKSASTWYNTPDVTFTNSAGFGAGGIASYRYAWDQNSTHTFNDTETKWSSSTLTKTATSDGSWYLHVKSFNGDDKENGTKDYGPYYYDGTPPAAPTSIDDGTDGWSRHKTPTFSWTAPTDISDIVGYYYAVDDDTPESGGTYTASTSCTLQAQSSGNHTFYVKAKNGSGLIGVAGSHLFRIDITDPSVRIDNPSDGEAVSGTVNIEASAEDTPSGIKQIDFYIDDAKKSTDTDIPYTYPWNADSSFHTIKVVATDNAGNTASDIHCVNPPTYYFTWYDYASPGMNGNWILIGNPSDTDTATAKVYIGKTAMGTYDIPAGGNVTPQYQGVIGGPVKVVSTKGQNLTLSQRVLCNNSFNEVMGTREKDLGKEYYFTWYDLASPGMNGNWILIGNPSDTDLVTAQVYIGNDPDPKGTYTIPAGGRVTPDYKRTIGGPVRVVADGNVIVSQRVVCNNSFNEVMGTRKEDLGKKYYFTWYDYASSGMNGNWILVANAGDLPTQVTIRIAGHDRARTVLVDPGKSFTPSFAGAIDGPVEVISDQNVIVSQRVIYKDSFNEVMGTREEDLGQEYFFTWYDFATFDMNGNWVLIANPSNSIPVTAQVYVGQISMGVYNIPPAGRAVPCYLGAMGGPVRVVADNKIIVSQRVIYKDSFNELMGTRKEDL